MINTKDVIIEACKALGLVAVFITLIFSREIYKALKNDPRDNGARKNLPTTKVGNGDQYDPKLKITHKN